MISKEQYPNLIRLDGVVMGFAQTEASGQAAKTEKGIMMLTPNVYTFIRVV